MAHHPPAYCKACDSFFEDTFIGFGEGSVRNTFIDFVSKCPTCGGPAKMLPGTYSVVGGALQAVFHSAYSPDQIARIREIYERVASEPHQSPIPEDVVVALDAIKPELGAAARLYNKDKAGLAALALVLSVVLARCDSAPLVEVNQPTNVTQVVNVCNQFGSPVASWPGKRDAELPRQAKDPMLDKRDE